MIEVKFTVKNMSPDFYAGREAVNGWGGIVGFNTLDAMAKYEKLNALRRDLSANIKRKEMQFNREFDLHMLIKNGANVAHDVSPRRGYEVHTFTFSKA